MPTSNAVPSADPSDLLFNAQKFDEFTTGAADSYTDRLGVSRLTVSGALRMIGYEVPVAFASGLSISRATQTVTSGGLTYHAAPSALPFTTTGTFSPAQWMLLSNVTATELASTGSLFGAGMLGYLQSNTYPSWSIGFALKVAESQFIGKQSVVGSITALKALDKTKHAAAFVTGYYAAGDGGGCGPVYLDASDGGTADDGVTVFVGLDGGRWKRLRLDTISTKECGCKADGTTADDVAMARFLPAVIAKKAKGLISAGVHKLATALIWDIGAGRGHGLKIEGQGLSVSVLDLQSTSSGTPFLLTSSAGSAFYWGFGQFSVLTSIAGVGAQIGKADLSDEFNAFRFDSVELKNVLNHASAVSADLAGHFQCMGSLIVNGGASKGLGVALTLSRVAFSRYTIAAGNAGIGVKFQGSFNFANDFQAIDAEEVTTGVLLTGSSQNKNTISSGTIVADTCVDSQLDASSDDFVIGAGVNLAPYSGGARLGGTNKLHARVLDNLITTPAFPASGVTVTNTTGQAAFVTIYNGSVSTVTVNGTAMTNSPAGSVLTQILTNGETIKVDYTGSPGWVWRGGLF